MATYKTFQEAVAAFKTKQTEQPKVELKVVNKSEPKKEVEMEKVEKKNGLQEYNSYKRICEANGLPTDGKLADLKKRVMDHIEAKKEETVANPSPEPKKEVEMTTQQNLDRFRKVDKLMDLLTHLHGSIVRAEESLGARHTESIRLRLVYEAVKKEVKSIAPDLVVDNAPKSKEPEKPKVVSEEKPATTPNKIVLQVVRKEDPKPTTMSGEPVEMVVQTEEVVMEKPSLFGRLFGWISSSNGVKLKVVKKETTPQINVVRKGNAPRAGGGWQGHSACSLIRWCGTQGWSKDQVKKAFAKLNISASDTTIGIQLNAAKHGQRGDPANLNAAQVNELNNAK